MATDIITRTGKAAALSAADNDQNLESFAGTVDAKTGDYTVLYTDQNKVIEFNKATAVTCTLDALATILVAIDTTRFRVTIKNIGAGLCTIDGNGAETIDGETTLTLSQYQSATLQIDNAGTAWETISDGQFASRHVNNSNLNANVSDTVFDISGSLASGLWESVGPTDSGANNIWTALDAVPLGAKWVELRIRGTLTVTGTTLSGTVYGRANGGAESTGTDNFLWSMVYSSSSATRTIASVTWAKVPISSSGLFDLLWSATGGASSTIEAHLTGYGW